MVDDKKEARIMRRRFLRSGAQSRTVHVVEDDSTEQVLIADSAANGEILALVAAVTANDRLLATSRRLVLQSPAGNRSFAWSEVNDVLFDPEAELARGRAKRDWSLLRFVARAGGELLTVEVEPGPSFWGLLNALKMAAYRAALEKEPIKSASYAESS